jgi:hypothetical protein
MTMMNILLSHWVVHLYVIVMAILGVLWIWFNLHPPRQRTPGPGCILPREPGVAAGPCCVGIRRSTVWAGRIAVEENQAR